MLLKFWLKILTSVMENVTEFEYKLNLSLAQIMVQEDMIIT